MSGNDRQKKRVITRQEPVGPRWDALRSNPAFAPPPKTVRLGEATGIKVTKVHTTHETLLRDSRLQWDKSEVPEHKPPVANAKVTRGPKDLDAKVTKVSHEEKPSRQTGAKTPVRYYNHKDFPKIRMAQKYRREGNKQIPIGKPRILVGKHTTRTFSQRYASQHNAQAKFERLMETFERSKAGSKTRSNIVTKMGAMVNRLPGGTPLPEEKTFRQKAKEYLKDKLPKRQAVVRTRFQHGEEHVSGKYKLGRYQYVGRSKDSKGLVINTSVYRAGGAERDRMRREARVRAKELQKRTRAHQHEGALIRQRLRQEKRSPAFFARSAALAKQQRAAAKQMFANKMARQTGYGRVPLKMLNGAAGMGGRAPGKQGAMAGVSRDVMYPARQHAAARTPQFLSRMMNPSMGRQTLGEAPSVSRTRGTDLFTTANTVQTGKFPTGGAGIFFRIDALAVLQNLTVNYPAAIRRGAVQAGNLVGRKLLDIVEPYVPKDTGLLYSTAHTNVSQTAGGMVDMEGGEAYPSDQMFGVSISYNAPYAELVYFDEAKRHGAEYNAYYGTGEKGERETARWIEAAFQKEGAAIGSLMSEYSMAITSALESAGGNGQKR